MQRKKSNRNPLNTHEVQNVSAVNITYIQINYIDLELVAFIVYEGLPRKNLKCIKYSQKH